MTLLPLYRPCSFHEEESSIVMPEKKILVSQYISMRWEEIQCRQGKIDVAIYITLEWQLGQFAPPANPVN
jgi:hypothetical protein